MRLALAALFVFVTLGCDQDVIVTDQAGKPVQNADVSPVSANMNGATVKTDANGVATIPTALEYIDQVQWVAIEKAGYESEQFNVTHKWPLKVVLKAATQPATAP